MHWDIVRLILSLGRRIIKTRRLVVLILAAILLGLTIWVTGMDRIGFWEPFSWGRIGREANHHIQMVVVAILVACAISVPLGVLITRRIFRRLTLPVIGGASVGQTMPSVAVIAIMLPLLGVGFRAIIVALVIYALLPILRNSYASVNNIDPAVIEAARGMGMSSWQIARRIEFPLARPVIMAGIRISTILAVGTAELAPLVGWKGLGAITFTGVFNREPLLIIQGAAPTALMAITLGLTLEVLERWMTPRGLRR